MKKIHFVPIWILLLLLASCTYLSVEEVDEELQDQTSAVQSQTPEAGKEVACEYPEINDPATWEKVNAFPIANDSMTEDELRSLCVDFFYYSKTAVWTPNRDVVYVKTADKEKERVFRGGVYGGLPYVHLGTGNIYRLLECIDEETGVVDMSLLEDEPTMFGNQCSVGSYWGWARVINSAQFRWTYDMVQSRGFLTVGPYTYDESIARFLPGEYDTKQIIADNGEQVMYQSYAMMRYADGLVASYSAGGHAMMCYSNPVVEYNADGTIDGKESYLTVIDQHSRWTQRTGEQGDTYYCKNYIDRRFSFEDLLKQCYLPFTFAEFLGTNPVERSETSFSHDGENIAVYQLRVASVTSNYGISDIFAVLLDECGNEILCEIKRADRASVKELSFSGAIHRPTWKSYADGKHRVEIRCQLGTGERITIYSGVLVE